MVVSQTETETVRGVAAAEHRESPAVWPGFAAVIVASTSYGMQGILAKYAYGGGANAGTILAIRFVVGAAAIWSLLPLLRRRPAAGEAALARRSRLGLYLLGLMSVSNSLFYYLALARIPVSTASLLAFMHPALTVLWSALFFGDRFTGRKGVALVLALVGAAGTLDLRAALASDAALNWWGVAFALFSATGYSWYAPLVSRFGRGASGVMIARHTMPVTALGFLVYMLLSGGPSGAMVATGWLACLLIGLMTAFSVVLNLTGIARIGPSRAAITAVSEPITVVVLSALLLGEPVTLAKVVGGACIVASIVILGRGRGR